MQPNRIMSDTKHPGIEKKHTEGGDVISEFMFPGKS